MGAQLDASKAALQQQRQQQMEEGRGQQRSLDVERGAADSARRTAVQR